MKSNSIIYLSHFIDNDTHTYVNRTNIKIDQVSDINMNDSANSFSFSTSSNHIGTHIDLPSHFYDSKKKCEAKIYETLDYDNNVDLNH